MHESEKAEDIKKKVEVETFRLKNKQRNLNTLKPLGMAGLIKTFESIPKGEKPKSERVIPDVADFLHRTEPSSDGVFKGKFHKFVFRSSNDFGSDGFGHKYDLRCVCTLNR